MVHKGPYILHYAWFKVGSLHHLPVLPLPTSTTALVVSLDAMLKLPGRRRCIASKWWITCWRDKSFATMASNYEHREVMELQHCETCFELAFQNLIINQVGVYLFPFSILFQLLVMKVSTLQISLRPGSHTSFLQRRKASSKSSKPRGFRGSGSCWRLIVISTSLWKDVRKTLSEQMRLRWTISTLKKQHPKAGSDLKSQYNTPNHKNLKRFAKYKKFNYSEIKLHQQKSFVTQNPLISCVLPMRKKFDHQIPSPRHVWCARPHPSRIPICPWSTSKHPGWCWRPCSPCAMKKHIHKKHGLTTKWRMIWIGYWFRLNCWFIGRKRY